MEGIVQSFLAGAPVLLLHFSVTVAMLVMGVSLYILITPYSELALIREGNTAAALSMGGVILGLGLPLAFCMATSVNVFDIMIFGTLALVMQLLAYRVADMLLRGLPKRIQEGEIGAAILLVSIKLAVSALNAAAVTG